MLLIPLKKSLYNKKQGKTVLWGKKQAHKDVL